MSTVQFSPARFLEDIRTSAAVIGAPFSEEVTRRVIDAYGDRFATDAVMWKATSRPGDALSYRFFSRGKPDIVSVAVRAGLLGRDSRVAPLITCWDALYDGAPAQHGDFDAGRGLAKTWMTLGGTRPVDDILDVAAVPDALKQHADVFHKLGLHHVRFTGVDYRHDTVNLYFRTRGPLTRERCTELVGLAAATPDAALTAEMLEFMPKGDFMVAATVSLDSGRIERVAFYATQLPAGRMPRVGDRLTAFFTQTPSYQTHDVKVVDWSFGPSGSTYIKAERAYCGDVTAFFKDLDVLHSGGTKVDLAIHE
jgi:4-hydroxyphenylpyruvate 3-dimethylallyltransferase